MVIDALIDQIRNKKNPCIVGIDPEWNKLPECYRGQANPAEGVFQWAVDVIDAVADVVPAIKPQMAFFEVFGADGIRSHQRIVQYAHEKGLLVVDDSKRNDIGNTARAYAFAHLDQNGPINADFLTVSPFLGADSMQPFVETAAKDGKGLFVLVRTSNPGSAEISEAINAKGAKVQDWLANAVACIGQNCVGEYGYSGIGAVVGATFPQEARQLRQIMRKNFFLVPGFGAQGGSAKDVVHCFNEDGLGAIVNSSRGILYRYLELTEKQLCRKSYRENVREQAIAMQHEVYRELKNTFPRMEY